MTPVQFHARKRLDGVYLVKASGCYGGVWEDRWVPLQWQEAYRQWCKPYGGYALLMEAIQEIGERVSLPRLRVVSLRRLRPKVAA